MEKPNRAERRRNKFGGGRATEHGGWPTHQPNPVFTGDAPADETASGTPATKPDVEADGATDEADAAADEKAESAKD